MEKSLKNSVDKDKKTYSYLKYNNNEDIKVKNTNKCTIKRKLKFEGHKNCFKAAQIENKINHSEKNKIDIDSFKDDKKKS